MAFEHAKVDTNVSPTLRLILCVIALFLVLAPLPLAIFYVYNFNRFKHSNILKKRYVSLSVTSSILFILWASINTPLFIIQNTLAHILAPIYITTLKSIALCMYPYLSHCSTWLLLARFWLTYFDFMWTKATLNEEWKVHINPQAFSKTEQWFLSNKATYGNLHIIRRKAWIISLCIASISALLFEISVFTTYAKASQIQAIDFLFYIVPIIIILVLWRKLPFVYDILFYRKEMLNMGLLTLISVVCYFIIIAVSLTIGDDVINAFCTAIVFGCFYCYSFIFFQTMWVLRKIKHANIHFGHMGAGYNREMSRSNLSTTAIFHRTHSRPTATPREKSAALPAILSNKTAFNLFMQHLSSEFSMECLLAFTEFTQYRTMLQSDIEFVSHIGDKSIAEIKNNHQSEKQIKVPDLTPTTPASGSSFFPDIETKKNQIKLQTRIHPYKTVILSSKLPRSQIVFGERGTIIEEKGNIKYLNIAMDLYTKYVRIGSEFEINVSYGMRCSVAQLIESCYDDSRNANENIEQDLYDLFESCRKELYRLMTHPCNRFMDTEKYHKLEQELNK